MLEMKIKSLEIESLIQIDWYPVLSVDSNVRDRYYFKYYYCQEQDPFWDRDPDSDVCARDSE
jgi:hypothetical protein